MSLTLEDSSHNIIDSFLSSNTTTENTNLLTQAASVVSENVTALVANATSLLQNNATDFVSQLRQDKVLEIDIEVSTRWVNDFLISIYKYVINLILKFRTPMATVSKRCNIHSFRQVSLKFWVQFSSF